MDAPDVTSGSELSDIGIILSAPEGRRITGFRVYNFYYFGGYAADGNEPKFSVPQSPGVDLEWISGGVFVSGDNDYYRYSWSDADWNPGEEANSIALSDICSRISERGGLESTHVDVTALDGIDVAGYPIARQCTGADALAPLL